MQTTILVFLWQIQKNNSFLILPRSRFNYHMLLNSCQNINHHLAKMWKSESRKITRKSRKKKHQCFYILRRRIISEWELAITQQYNNNEINGEFRVIRHTVDSQHYVKLTWGQAGNLRPRSCQFGGSNWSWSEVSSGTGSPGMKSRDWVASCCWEKTGRRKWRRSRWRKKR